MYMCDPNVQVWDEASQIKPSQGTPKSRGKHASARRTKPAQRDNVSNVL